MTTPQVIPEGYRQNALGHLVPINLIAPLDLQRDDLVRALINKVKDAQFALEALKVEAYDDIEAHMQLSAAEYDVELGGELGNLTLATLDGSMAIKIAIDRPIVFDEKIHAAKALIDECLSEWSESNVNLQSIVHEVFKTDKKGNLDVKSVLSLRKIKIKDERWKRAMEIINDSIDRTKTKKYIRFYERGGEEKKLAQISLNFTAM